MTTVSKNIFWSTLHSAIQLYTGSVVFIVLAKLMSVEDFGVLSFGYALSALAVIVADFGFSLMIMKDYPQRSNGDYFYISNSLVAKLVISCTASILFFTYLILFYREEWLQIGSLYVLFAIIASFVIYLQALLKVQNRFQKHAESTIVYAIAVTICIMAYWLFTISLVELVLLLSLSKILQLLWTLYLCRNALRVFSFNRKTVQFLIRNSWSFGLHTVLGIFYFMIDTQIISLYLGAKEVALYQSVFRIILILLIFSDIINNVFLPYLSFKYYQKSDLSEIISKVFFYLLLVSCSLFLIFTSFKNQILDFAYTNEYRQAAILVLPLSIVVILRTVSSLLGNILTISNRQSYRVLTVGISLITSLILNLIFIPKYGIIGAAWVSVLVHSILFCMYWVFSTLEVSSLRLHTLSNVSAIMGTASIYLGIQYLSKGEFGFVIVCAFLWMSLIFILMKQNNNLQFLKNILEEKGVG